MFVACCLEAGAATTTASIVTFTLAWDIGALVFAGMSIESYNQGAIFIAAGGDAVRLAEEQLNTASACDLGVSASTMSKCGWPSSCSQPSQDCHTNITAVLSFILVLKHTEMEYMCYLGIIASSKLACSTSKKANNLYINNCWKI